MPWVRFDDQFTIHRKVAGMTDAAFRLHVSAIFWCARNLTDGFLPEEDLDDVCARVRTPARFATECVKKGAWHAAAYDCGSEKCPGPVDKPGWVIHDYLEYQFSKDQVLRDREANKERQRRHRETRNGSSNAVTNAMTNSTPSRPVPVDPVVDVVSRTNGSSARDPTAVIDAIIKEIHDQTGKVIDPDWAVRIAAELVTPGIANPAAYVRQCIRNEPNPGARFLPHSQQAYGRHARTETP